MRLKPIPYPGLLGLAGVVVAVGGSWLPGPTPVYHVIGVLMIAAAFQWSSARDDHEPR
jgi:hypothetical protein